MYATKQTNYQQIAKSFGATATTSNNTDDSIKSSEFDRRSLTMTRSRSPAMVSSSRDNSSDSGIASPTLTGTFDWPVTSGSGCCDDVPFIKIQSLNKQFTSDGVYSNESGVCQTDVSGSSEEVAPRSKYQAFHQLRDVTDDEDDVLLDERTAFESELSWKDEFEKDNNDDELSPILSCSFVSGLPDHMTFDDDDTSSSDDDSGVSKPMMIPNAHQRQRCGRSERFLVSTPTANAGIDVDACYPGYPCSFQKREAPATSNIYQMMQQLRMQTRPSESDIFVYPTHARGHIVPGRCQVGFNQTPNLSCI